eukprot:scaffold57085_cov31-Tisochrysis_lutea.AAC.5
MLRTLVVNQQSRCLAIVRDTPMLPTYAEWLARLYNDYVANVVLNQVGFEPGGASSDATTSLMFSGFPYG